MTPHDHEDQEFENFLRGQGELAQQLQGLAQPQPSENLTRAILADAEHALAARQAANDPVIPNADRLESPSKKPRMHMPLALAASVVLCIVGALLWHDVPAPDARVVIAQTEAPPITDDSVVMRSIPTQNTDTAQDKPPQVWMTTISTLLQQGKSHEALDAWDKFRKAWPDYPVPEVLQTQIDALEK